MPTIKELVEKANKDLATAQRLKEPVKKVEESLTAIAEIKRRSESTIQKGS